MKGFVAIVGLCLLNSGCALAGFPQAKVTYRVVDEQGAAFARAPISCAFIEASGSSIEGVTGTNGIFVAQHGSSGGASASVDIEGYYRGSGGIAFTNLNKVLRRFEPWNPTVEVVMKEIRNPVGMKYLTGWKRPKIPVYDTPLGFDLEKGDWVSPYGSGANSDFIFTARKFPDAISGIRIEVSFPNEFDGILEYPFDPKDRSAFRWPYEAPENGYTNSLMRYVKFYEGVVDYSKLYPGSTFKKVVTKREDNLKHDKDINYIFRVRSEVDEHGNLVRACYGKIQGEIKVGGDCIHLSYWFNPHWTRNLEDDPKRNIRLD